jgi:hypothetical protein
MELLEELIETRRKALQQALERQKDRGLSLAEWARKAGIGRQTIRNYLSGISRSMYLETYDCLAIAAGCSVTELLEVTHQSPITVPVMGYLGVGSEVVGYSDIISTNKEQHVDALPRMNWPQSAIIVAGESCAPRFNHGDIVYHRNAATPATELIGQESVVQVEDGRMFVKTILQGRGKDRFSLTSPGTPVISDVGLVWAKPITWIARKAGQTGDQTRPFGQYAALIRRAQSNEISSKEARASLLSELDELRGMLLSRPPDGNTSE